MLKNKTDLRRIAIALEGIRDALERGAEPKTNFSSKWIKLDPKTGQPFEAADDG